MFYKKLKNFYLGSNKAFQNKASLSKLMIIINLLISIEI